jgi:hypothetical protein
VVVSSFLWSETAPAGLAWDVTAMWLSDVNTDAIYRLSDIGGLYSSFSSPCGDPMDLAWDGQYLWVIDAWGNDGEGNVLYKVGTDGTVITSFSVDADLSTGLTWDGSYLWCIDLDNYYVFKLSES